MQLFDYAERSRLKALSQLNYCNPFTKERRSLERAALGDAYRDSSSVWSVKGSAIADNCNLIALAEMAAEMAERSYAILRDHKDEVENLSEEDVELYQDTVLYHLYHCYKAYFGDIIVNRIHNPDFSFFTEFEQTLNRFMSRVAQHPTVAEFPAERVFALFFQMNRAFFHTFHFIAGESAAVAQLRASVWESVFTHDLRRYFRFLYQRMQDFTTLITGPSGSGKEIVARALALSGFIPFNRSKATFDGDFREAFLPTHLSAMPPALLESELFGHCKGAFTGASHERLGRLEACPSFGAVFLDEIAEVSEEIQVKLLRVLQQRSFQRVGSNKPVDFKGKVIAATNQDLPERVEHGGFRADFYYRLCSDRIITPSLAECIENEEELSSLVRFVAEAMVGPEEGEYLHLEVLQWIVKNLGHTYSWPGNFRELEQCVKSILIRGEYEPLQCSLELSPTLIDLMKEGEAPAEQVLAQYCQMVYEKSGNYSVAARKLGLDRRTVRKYVRADESLSE